MTGRTPRGCLVALSVALVAWGAFYVFRTSFVVDGQRVYSLWDDAMITMRYAHNMSAGRGLVWNPGEPVQGYTNVLITLVMAAIHYLPLPLKWMSLVFQLLNLGLLAAGLVLVDRLARLWFAGERFVAPAAATATVVCATPAIWALQGSDVGFALVWLLAAVAAFTRFEARRATSCC